MVNVSITMTHAEFCSWRNLLTPGKINAEATVLLVSTVPSMKIPHVERRESRVGARTCGEGPVCVQQGMFWPFPKLMMALLNTSIRLCDLLNVTTYDRLALSSLQHTFTGILKFPSTSQQPFKAGRWGNWGLGKLNALPKVTWIISAIAGTWTRSPNAISRPLATHPIDSSA